MFLFKKKKENANIEEVITKVNKKDLIYRIIILVIGCFITAAAFNLFFLQYGIVCFGISGLSIVLNQYGVNPSIFIFVMSIVLLVISFFLLGWKVTKNSVIGSLIFPLCVYLTEGVTSLININGTEMILVAVFGAAISGLGYGLIFKTGWTTGGTDIINQIISKYFKMSIGKAMILVDGLVVLSGKLVFGWDILMYGFIVLYIISMITDKVILGISQAKAFYIITSKEDETRDFLIKLVDSGLTIIEAKGGYSNSKQSLLLCVIPTKKYFLVKEGLKEIDKDAFFLVTDSYEVSGKKV